MRQLRRAIAFLLLVWLLPGCSTYRTTDLTPQEAVTGQEAVRVTLADAEDTQLTVKDPWVRADSIGGMTDSSDDWAVPLSSVREVKTKQLNAALTAVVVVAVGVGIGVAILYKTCAIPGPSCAS